VRESAMQVEKIVFARVSRVPADALTENAAVNPTASRSPRRKHSFQVTSKDLSGTLADFQMAY
jgi:hypothetical protein